MTYLVANQMAEPSRPGGSVSAATAAAVSVVPVVAVALLKIATVAAWFWCWIFPCLHTWQRPLAAEVVIAEVCSLVAVHSTGAGLDHVAFVAADGVNANLSVHSVTCIFYTYVSL